MVKDGERPSNGVAMVLGADWTIIATGIISGISGLSGALLGYLAARIQTRGEIQRQREQQRQAEQVEKRSDYVSLLNEERRIYALLHTGPAKRKEEIEGWLNSLHGPLNSVMLIGSNNVARAAVELDGVLRAVGDQTVSFHNGQTTFGDWYRTYDRWEPVRQALVDAMREDVGAATRPLRWPQIESRAEHFAPIAHQRLSDIRSSESEAPDNA
jgi:hypothetical protein